MLGIFTNTIMRFCYLLLFFLFGLSTILSAQNLKSELELLRTSTLYFGSDSIAPDVKSDSVLAVEKAKLRGMKGLIVEISAYTDNIGSVAYNENLAFKRGQTVLKLIDALSLDIDSLGVSIYGERNPVVNNKDEGSRQRNRRVRIDVYKQRDLALVKRQVLASGTAVQGLQSELRLQTSYRSDTLFADTTGYIEFYAPVGEHISLFYLQKDYFFGGEELEVRASDTLVEAILLKELELGLKGDVNELNFVGGQPVILPYHYSRLNDLIDFLKLNASISVHIGGHVNVPGKREPINSVDGKLAHRRALKVYGELIKNGINPARLSYKGYSNWFMKYPNPKNSIEQRQNRRVEVSITSLDFKADK
jgi:outer membrane protein OmpA-like peptidoglycan-associated protein